MRITLPGGRNIKNIVLSDALRGTSTRVAGIQSVSMKNANISDNVLNLEADSQIEFSLKNFISNKSVLVHLRVEAVSLSLELTPKLYLDYGSS